MRGKDLGSLTNCKNLKWLGIGNDNSLTDDDLAPLAEMVAMERLSIAGDGLTDAGLIHLANMDSLNSLTLSGSLTDAGLRHLAGLDSLEMLTIKSNNRFSHGALKLLKSRLPNARLFNIDQDRASGKPLQASLKVGHVAPPFNLKSLDGQEMSIANHRGKVLLLYFWSTSCAPCIASMPKSKESYEVLSKYDDFAMLGLKCASVKNPKSPRTMASPGIPATFLSDATAKSSA